jgi:L-Ala-D/L-Glu epimerase
MWSISGPIPRYGKIMIALSVTTERWPVAGAFIIARGTKTHVDVIVVTATKAELTGRGEGTPIYYHGETADSCAAQIRSLPARIDRATLQTLLPRGAARNAADCALWDLEAQQAGMALWRYAGLDEPRPLQTAMTVSLGAPEMMEADARALGNRFGLLKLKLSGDGDLARVAAVKRGAPGARLIVDANESWTGRDVAAEATKLADLGVEMIEQPVKAGADHLLDGVSSPIPFVADESCQDRADLPNLVGRYQGINIKLDKAGGLTEALALRAEAVALGFQVMVGCMLATSLGIAPAFLVAQQAHWVDLDGALLLAKDRDHRLRETGGLLHPPFTQKSGQSIRR